MSAAGVAALKLAGRGWPVFPVDSATKRPLTAHGFKDAATDIAQIRAWWERHPRAGVAIPTGRRTKLAVVDVDPRHGGVEGIQDAADLLGSLPPTLRASTPSGGWHYFLALPDDVPDIPNSAGKLAEGVDVRAVGGYVVVPPGPGREWTVRRPPARVPDEWAAAMRSTVPLAADGDEAAGPRPAGRISWQAIAREGVPEGRRHDVMVQVVGQLLGRRLPFDLAADLAGLFNDARCRPPLPAAELDRIRDDIGARELAKRRGGRR